MGKGRQAELLVAFPPPGISTSLWGNSHRLGQMQKTLRFPHGLSHWDGPLEKSRKRMTYRTIRSMIHLLRQPKTHPEWVRISQGYWAFRALRNRGEQGDHKGTLFIGYLVCSHLTCTSFTSVAHLAALQG